jgi:GcrA cell cycle regulator
MEANPWTDDGVALLRQLWTEGATAAAIGQRLGGLSRSAVLGKIFRMRLRGEGDATSNNSALPEQTASAPNTPTRRRKQQPRQRIVPPPPAPAGRLTLLELTNESCRWPSGRSRRFFFCGVAEADVQNGIPYCPRHMRRAYNGTVTFEKSGRPDFARAVVSTNAGVPA